MKMKKIGKGNGARRATLTRKTGETEVRVVVCLDGAGSSRIATGISFFDHMLTQLARHGLMDLAIRAKGDLEVDLHHTVEDVGITLGRAVRRALRDKKGIRRYGDATVPMEEALVTVALDLSGRPHLHFAAPGLQGFIATFDVALVKEFLRALASSLGATLHVILHHGENLHHMVEAIFKGLARALRVALEKDPRSRGVPSTKGTL